MSAPVKLRREELDVLVADVRDLVPIAGGWFDGMGFDPEALRAIADRGAGEALGSVRRGQCSVELAMSGLYLAGFTLGVLAERAVQR